MQVPNNSKLIIVAPNALILEMLSVKNHDYYHLLSKKAVLRYMTKRIKENDSKGVDLIVVNFTLPESNGLSVIN